MICLECILHFIQASPGLTDDPSSHVIILCPAGFWFDESKNVTYGQPEITPVNYLHSLRAPFHQTPLPHS